MPVQIVADYGHPEHPGEELDHAAAPEIVFSYHE